MCASPATVGEGDRDSGGRGEPDGADGRSRPPFGFNWELIIFHKLISAASARGFMLSVSLQSITFMSAFCKFSL